MSEAGKEVLKEMGAPMPDEASFPTGAQLISEYLEVLQTFLDKSGKCQFKFNSELVSVRYWRRVCYRLFAVIAQICACAQDL